MKTADDYRITEIEKVTLNGNKIKGFKAFLRKGSAFVFIGAYTAPASTADENLWLIPNADGAETTE